MNEFTVYIAIVEDSFYVGYTTNFKKRCLMHKSSLKHNRHWNTKLQEAYNNSTTKEVNISKLQEVSSEEEAYNLEQYVIANNVFSDASCVNQNLGNDTWINCQDTDGRKARISQGMRNFYDNFTEEERKEKYGRSGEANGMFGKTHSEEAKAIFRENIKKAIEANKGRKFSEEHREKISKAASLRTGEANAFFGKQHTEESKKKMSEAMKGSIPTNARKIIADGVEFPSVTACARHFNITYNAVAFRIKSPNFDYHYINA